jgi:hypothetical protein
MIEVSIDTASLARMERALLFTARTQIPFATARALNDCARAARDSINNRAGEIFDRPTSFTQRAVVAPRELAAAKDNLSATVTVRPIQQKYLLSEEVGGTRDPAANTRKPGASAIALPGRGLLLDQYGGIPAGTIARIKRAMASAETAAHAKRQKLRSKAKRARSDAVKPRDRGFFYVPKDGHNGLPGGFYQRLPGHRIAQRIGFAGQTHYKPRWHFRDHVAEISSKTFTKALMRRLIEAAASAK